MGKKTISYRLKSALYIFFSFLIAVSLCFAFIGLLLESTILNSDFIYDNMNSSNYFVDKKDEINRKLTDLGYASGLDEEFFEGFVDELMISKDTRQYLDHYYEGKSSVIDTENFCESFNKALDRYVEEKNINKVDSKGRDYLIKTASRIYRGETELPFFNTLSFYIVNLKTYIPIMLGGLLVFVAILVLVIVFTNKWKHRAVRYIYYGTSTVFLVTIIPALYLLISKKISQITISSRALYNLLVECANGATILMLFYALFLMTISIGLFILHRRIKNKS